MRHFFFVTPPHTYKENGFFTTPYMESGCDVFYLTEDRLRAVIRSEIERVRGGNGSDWSFAELNWGLARNWQEENRAEANDLEDHVDDIIAFGLHSSHTHSGLPDLIEIPDDVRPEVVKTTFYRKIFAAKSECSGLPFDVMAGRAEFTRYIFDFRNVDQSRFLSHAASERTIEKKWLEFTEFTMTDVMVNNFVGMNSRKIVKDHAQEMVRKGRSPVWRGILRKAEKPLKRIPDMAARAAEDRDRSSAENVAKFREQAYSKLGETMFEPPISRDFGHAMSSMTFRKGRRCKYYSPNEMFKAGADVTCLPRHTWSANEREALDGVAVARSLEYAFQI